MDTIEADNEVTAPLVRQFKASELLQSKKHILHDLLQKQPVSMGAVQTVCGIMLFGLGVVLTIASPVNTFGTLLRVPALTGLLFFFSGLVTFLMYRFPELLPVSFFVNIGSLVVASLGTLLLIADVARPNDKNKDLNEQNNARNVVILVLTVTLLEIVVTSILLYWLYRERRRNKHGGKAQCD